MSFRDSKRFVITKQLLSFVANIITVTAAYSRGDVGKLIQASWCFKKIN